MFPSVPVQRKQRSGSVGVVAAVALLLTTAACGAPRSSEASPAVTTSVVTTTVPATTTTFTATTSSTTTSSTTTSSTTTVLTAPPGTESSVPTRPCTLSEVGVDQILVFGNSTDYTFGPDEGIDLVAWPELLVDQDRTGLLAGVNVINEAQPGQTMGTWDAWGPDPKLRLNGYAVTVLDALGPAALQTTLVLVAPSFIDLQESDGDIDRAITDLQSILATIESYGLDALVLPMNYVSTTIDDRLPELNPDVDEFNRALRASGLMAEPLLDSPLRGDAERGGGEPSLYDDFPGRADDGTFTGPDGFHPDAEGQLVKTSAVNEVLTSFIERTQRAARCPS